MPAPKGQKVPSRAPKNPRGGRRLLTTYAERYAAEPEGTTLIRVPNAALAYIERVAAAQGLSVVQWLSRQEIEARIV